MCGIVGYIGSNKAVPYLLEGLERLEYRGYDSAGIAVFENGAIKVTKTKGRIGELCKKINDETAASTVGIGHTRWATHGKPSDENAHPHLSRSGLFCVVHNGIIENYACLRRALKEDGYTFASETDTEVIAHLLEKNYCGEPVAAVRKTVGMLEGSFALAILCKDFPNRLICTRRESPLVVGMRDSDVFAASDVTAILKYTRDVYKLDNDETAVLERDGVTFYDRYGRKTQKQSEHIEWKACDARRDGYEHFMLKEIEEQPKAVADTLCGRISGEKKITFDSSFKLTDEDIKSLDRIIITACGSAYHVGVNSKYILEKTTRLPTSVEIASEYRYSDPVTDKNTLVIVISQSGETADSLAALRLSNQKGAKTLGIVNVASSSIANESQSVIYTHAGPEIAVATTKAYSAQLAVMYMLSLYISERRGTVCEEELNRLACDIEKLPDKIRQTLASCKKETEELSLLTKALGQIYYIGRNLDHACALEASLKMKEISYIPSQAYAAGELKHGTISLIEKGTLVIALAANDEVFQKTASNIKEVTARGAQVIAVTTKKHSHELSDVQHTLTIPQTNPLLMTSLEVIPMQLLSYYTAKELCRDIDKPRNLAKSVTVE